MAHSAENIPAHDNGRTRAGLHPYPGFFGSYTKRLQPDFPVETFSLVVSFSGRNNKFTVFGNLVLSLFSV
jgi:hypothetical protein